MSDIKHTMTCDQFGDLLADVLERTADETTRARVEAHALACSDCGSLLADLRKLRIDAANLPELAPSRDLWSGIAARIETPVVAISPATSQPVRSRRRLAPVWLGLAAAGLVGITATITHEMTKRSDADRVVAQIPLATITDTQRTTPGSAAASVVKQDSSSRTSRPSTQAASAAPVTRLASNDTRLSPQQTYDQEISRLRAIVNQRRPQLDSATVAVIEHNLEVIDDAIAQCREALAKDPNSRFLMESLNDAFDTKVRILRAAASLPSRA